MATVNATRNDFQLAHTVVSWGPLTTTNSVGSAESHGGAGQCSVQIEGTFGALGTFAIEGSNDGANWHALADPSGASLGGITAAGIYGIREEVLYVRPRLASGGDGTTSITVTLLTRKNVYGG